MRRIALTAVLLALSATPGLAQNFVGNWSCRDQTTERVGILTIYGQVYGYAARVKNNPWSGTGTITPYQDGVAFNDGPLQANGGVTAGRMVPEPTYGSAIQLETPSAIIMLCTPR